MNQIPSKMQHSKCNTLNRVCKKYDAWELRIAIKSIGLCQKTMENRKKKSCFSCSRYCSMFTITMYHHDHHRGHYNHGRCKSNSALSQGLLIPFRFPLVQSILNGSWLHSYTAPNLELKLILYSTYDLIMFLKNELFH